MKQGTTPTIEFKLDIDIENVTEVIFTFTDELAYKGTSEDDTPNYLLQKNYPDDATFEDDTFKLPLTQEETDLLTNTFYVEAQVICGTAVVKSDVKRVNMPHTLWTTYVDDNESDGQSEVIHLTFSDNVIVEGSGSSNYNDLSNKPKINNIELIGNKTTSDLGLDITTGDGLKREGNVLSVDLASESNLYFADGKLKVSTSDLGVSRLRQSLANTSLVSSYGALASKSYVDNLMSGATKWEFVQQLPTQDIDIHTIYFVPKSTAETDNYYDEWVYALKSRNPDVYDWELLGTSQVDLSNYYTKDEVDNKFTNTTNGSCDVASQSSAQFINVSNYSTFIVTSDLVQAQQSGLMISLYDSNDTRIQEEQLYDTTTHQPKLIDIAKASKVKVYTYAPYTFSLDYQLTNEVVRERELTTDLADKQDKLTGGDGIDISNDTVSVDLSSSNNILQFDNSKLLVNPLDLGKNLYVRSYLTDTSAQYPLTSKDYVDTELAKKQNTIDSTHKLSADNVDDTSTTNKFVPSHSSSESGKVLGVDSNGDLEWTTKGSGGSYSAGDGIDITNDTISVDLKSGTELQITSGELDIDLSSYATTTSVSGKEDKTTISTDTTSTTDTLDLLNNTEQRYIQELSSLTLTLPLTIDDDFISSVVFKSGTTATQMTYDSSIKWSGDDVTNGQFVPSADKDYDIMMYYNGLNINGIVRGV